MAAAPDSPYRRQVRWWRAEGSTRPKATAREEFDALAAHGRAALLEALRRWEKGACRPSEVKALGDGLVEIRVKVGTDPFRAILFQDSPVHDVVVLAIYKNQQRLPKQDLELAKQRRNQWKATGRSRA